MFGRAVPEMSMIVNEVVDFIYETHDRKLIDWNETLLDQENLGCYVDAIHRKGAALDNCFDNCFDGTLLPICSAGRNQHPLYNVHKRLHS